MTREQKQKWVDALRSGEFRQTQERLYNAEEDAYCCLGVACKVLGRKIVAADDDSIGMLGGSNDDNSYKWLVDVAKINEDFRITLSEANDEEGLTFAEIADKIEKELQTED